MRTILFFLTFIIVFALMNAFVHFRFVQRLSLPDIYRNAGTGLVLFLFLCQMLYAASFRLDVLPGWLYLVLGSAIGFSFMLFVVALSYDLIRAVTDLILKLNGGRLRPVIDGLALLVMIVYLIAGVLGGMSEPAWVHVRVPVSVPGHSAFRIIQLSDVHVGHVIRKPFVERLVARINESVPDIVVITGDLIDRDPDRIAGDLAPLAHLKTRYGVYFAAGNHEYFHRPLRSLEILRSLGMKVLDDESTEIHDSSGRAILNIVGLRDQVGRRMQTLIPDPDKAFASVNRNLPTIVLAHQPVWIKEIERFRPDLVLSGHTHGGQIFPFSYLVYLNQPYLSGLHSYQDGRYIYISRGTGFWGPPIRVLAPSEITELILSQESIESGKKQ